MAVKRQHKKRIQWIIIKLYDPKNKHDSQIFGDTDLTAKLTFIIGQAQM